MENNFSNEINEISTFLEEKYKIKFIIDDLVSDVADPGNPNKAYAYPEGRKSEWFAVRIDVDKGTKERVFSDGYGFVLAEQKKLPEYRAWIAEVIPGGKIAIYIENDTEVTIGDYSTGFNMEEFVEEESPYAINMTIFAGSDMLADRTAFFEKLSQSIDEKLDRRFCYKMNIAFANVNPDSLDADEYRGASSFTIKSADGKFIALTKVFIVEEMSKDDIFNELEDEFTEDMKLDLSGMEDDDYEDDEDGDEDE